MMGYRAKAALTWGIPPPAAAGASRSTSQPAKNPKLKPTRGKDKCEP